MACGTLGFWPGSSVVSPSAVPCQADELRLPSVGLLRLQWQCTSAWVQLAGSCPAGWLLSGLGPCLGQTAHHACLLSSVKFGAGCQAKELKEMMLHPCGGVAVDAVDYNAWQWVMWLEDFEEGSELEKVRTARTPELCSSALHCQL